MVFCGRRYSLFNEPRRLGKLSSPSRPTSETREGEYTMHGPRMDLCRHTCIDRVALSCCKVCQFLVPPVGMNPAHEPTHEGSRAKAVTITNIKLRHDSPFLIMVLDSAYWPRDPPAFTPASSSLPGPFWFPSPRTASKITHT
jgi:hypothetical protein